jgi:predicted ABC-type ATPase
MPNKPPNKKRWIKNPSDLCQIPNNDKINEYVNIIYKIITKGKTPSINQLPQLIITIGCPGAGKSTILHSLIKDHSDIPYDNYVNFDCDKLLDYLPMGEDIKNIPDMHGNRTGIGYAFGWAECMSKLSTTNIIGLVIKKVLKSNYNFILNSHYYYTIIDAQLNGYFCILVYVIASKNIAKSRVKTRSEELGRFFSLDYKKTFGWSKSIEQYLNSYREKSVWYSLWADRFVIVANNKKNKFPQKNDFKIIKTHIDEHEKLNGWKLHIKKIYNIIEKLEHNI